MSKPNETVGCSQNMAGGVAPACGLSYCNGKGPGWVMREAKNKITCAGQISGHR